VKRLLPVALAPVFAHIDNAIVLSGHTDSVPFQSQYYSNWELSGARAMRARKIMIEILVLTEEAEADLLGLFDPEQPDSELSRARRAAEFNQPVTR